MQDAMRECLRQRIPQLRTSVCARSSCFIRLVAQGCDPVTGGMLVECRQPEAFETAATLVAISLLSVVVLVASTMFLQ